MSPLIWLASLAMGQAEPPAVPDVNAQTFRPSIDAEQTLWVDDLRGGREGWGARVLMHYTERPLAYRYASGATTPVLDGVAMGDLLVGWGDARMRFGLDVPLVLSAEGVAASGEFGLGDVVAHGRFTVVDPVDDDDLGLGVALRYGLPTATTANPLGTPGGDGELSALVDGPAWGPFSLVANLGFGVPLGVQTPGLGRAQFRGRAGARLAFSATSGSALEVELREPLAGLEEGAPPSALATRELLWSAYARSRGTTVRGGLGTSLGGDGVGAADLRAVLGVAFGKDPPPPDTDGDGLADPDDACIDRPEDLDGVKDGDGCPEPPARVTVLVKDALGQRVAAQVEVAVGDELVTQPSGSAFDLEPGTYVATVVSAQGNRNPHELVVTEADMAPTVTLPEEILGFVSLTLLNADGTPATEARVFAGRRLVASGAEWKGTLGAGERALVVRAPGHRPRRLVVTVPAEGVVSKTVTLKPARAALQSDGIALDENVRFDSGAATLLPASLGLLDEVVAILDDHPEIRELRIEGHTDTQGAPEANLALSQARAEAVRAYLIEAGIAPERLVAEGFGASQPLDPADTEAAHEVNRRVVFRIGKLAR